MSFVKSKLAAYFLCFTICFLSLCGSIFKPYNSFAADEKTEEYENELEENDLFITSEADVKEFHDLWNKYITDNTFPKPTYANLKKLQAEVEKGKKQMLYLIVGNSKDEKDISSISNLIKLHTSLHRAKKHNEYNVQDTIS